LKAFNPYYAFEYLIRNQYMGWRSMGGILLAFTGVEALFADIGAFSRRAVQISWLGYAYPCLLLAYSGQAAFISVHPEAYSNPFYNCVPNGWLIFSLVIAVLAAIVASQAMITATFQVCHFRTLSGTSANIS
jgi:KUP system potassium uptake protein